jgi:methyl acetate hydrolase
MVEIIQKIGCEDLDNYFVEKITVPLNMESTWFNLPEDLWENIVSWEVGGDTTELVEFPLIPNETVTTYNAGSGLFGSPKDYLKFLFCIANC